MYIWHVLFTNTGLRSAHVRPMEVGVLLLELHSKSVSPNQFSMLNESSWSIVELGDDSNLEIANSSRVSLQDFAHAHKMWLPWITSKARTHWVAGLHAEWLSIWVIVVRRLYRWTEDVNSEDARRGKTKVRCSSKEMDLQSTSEQSKTENNSNMAGDSGSDPPLEKGELEVR